MGMFFAYNNRQSELHRLQAQAPLLEEKTTAIENFKKSETKKKNFLEDFPQSLDEDELKDFVTDLAVKYHIKIQSFSSIDASSNENYELLSLELNFIVEDFVTLVLFINELESSEYALRVDNWQGQMNMNEQYSRGRSGVEEKNKSPIGSRVKITTLKIKK